MNKELIDGQPVSLKKVVLVGAGNVATHLGPALCDAGYEVVQVFSRTEASASALAGKLHCPYTTTLDMVNPEADMYIVSVKDSALEKVIPPLVSCHPDAFLYIRLEVCR